VNMPFGKHAGIAVSKLPDEYLDWLLHLPDLRDPLKFEVEAEAERRIGGKQEARVPRLLTGEFQSVAHEIIKTGYKQLSLKFHPDTGGTHHQFITLAAAKEALDMWLKNGATL
jgi:hypothetical protein